MNVAWASGTTSTWAFSAARACALAMQCRSRQFLRRHAQPILRGWAAGKGVTGGFNTTRPDRGPADIARGTH